MADTIRGYSPDAICVDCGVKGCSFIHNGPLVEGGSWQSFCGMCFFTRSRDGRQGKQVRPLGSLSMLAALEVIEEFLPVMLANKESEWNTIDVNYHAPFVKRVWGYYNSCRVSLHKIYPCEEGEALFHPHPWPSAMRILSGKYEMAVGFGAGDEPPPVATKLILPAGTTYEMTHPDGWHYVRPLDEPAFSLLVTANPWKRSSPKGKDLQPLPENEKEEIMEFFKNRYPLPARQ